MLAGLIGAAAGGLKGAADAYSVGAKSEFDSQQKLDISKQLLQMEEEKALRVDAITRTRNVEDVGRLATAGAAAAPIVAGGVVAGQVAGEVALKDSNLPQLKAQNKVTAFEADDKYGVNIAKANALKAELLANKDNVELAATQEATAKAKAFVAAGSVKDYYKNVTLDKSAREGSAEKATAALANFNLATAKGVELIKKEIVTARANKDEAGVLAAEQKLSTMQGGVKSYADVIKAASIYESMAKDVLDPMKNGGLDDQIAQQQAALLRQAAVGLLEGVSSKRGMGGKTDAPGAASTVNPSDFDKRPKAGPASAPAAAVAAPAPVYEPPADSPAGKSKAMREEATLKQAAWDKEMSSKANTALTALDLSDLSAVDNFQQGPLFRYLTPQQKAKVSKAATGK